MNNVSLIKLDLTDQALRAEYSKRLQAMEYAFTYPLGEAEFVIRHGFGSQDYDYFSYFEQLGQPCFYVVELSGSMVGSVCCVLRVIEGQKVWYICDLKILPTAQFKQIPALIYQLLHENLRSISSAFYFVNMSPENHNGLSKVARQLMVGFRLKILPYYIYELTQEHINDDVVIAHNHGKKDIVMNGQTLDLYHVMNGANDRCDHVQYACQDQLSNRSIIMLGSTKLIDHYVPNSEGIFVSCNFTLNDDLSTFEV
mgnify:FL=1